MELAWTPWAWSSPETDIWPIDASILKYTFLQEEHRIPEYLPRGAIELMTLTQRYVHLWGWCPSMEHAVG